MIGQALKNLAPTGEWSIDYNGTTEKINWVSTDIPQPTEAEIQAEVERLQAEYDAHQYQRDRALEYPSIEDQLDYIYHNGLDRWKTDIINPIKTKYPKG